MNNCTARATAWLTSATPFSVLGYPSLTDHVPCGAVPKALLKPQDIRFTALPSAEKPVTSSKKEIGLGWDDHMQEQ